MTAEPDKSESDNPTRWIAGIMVLVAAWGAVQAVGAWLLNHDPRRPLMVLGCVLGFLGFWLTMLWLRSSRLRRS